MSGKDPRQKSRRLPAGSDLSKRGLRHIFISYAHKDSLELASRIQHDLTTNGFTVWLDTSRIQGGGTWSANIERAIDQAEVVLALLSEASFRSEVCRGEQLRALRNGKCVIPVLVKPDADRPVYLEARHYRDFSDGAHYEKSFDHLLSDITARRGGTLVQHYRKTDYETVPPLPLNYLERPDALTPLRNALMNDDSSRHLVVTGVRGMGGVGKTVLVQALCRRDEVIQAAFPDGIAWVTVGQEPGNLVAQMRDVARALGESVAGFDTPDESVKRLRAILHTKAALIVLDDVWDAQFVESFRAEAPRCRVVFTTRNASVAAALGAREYAVDVLGITEALELLARQAQTTVQSLPAEANEVVRQCGCLPLAVAIVGALVRGKHHRWKNVLQKLRSADLEHLGLKLPSYTYADLFKAIQVGVDALEPDLRDHYDEIAVFPDGVAVPNAALQVLWNCDHEMAEEITDHFTDLSLATRDRHGRLVLHDLQWDFLRKKNEVRVAQLHDRLLSSYGERCGAGWRSGPNDGYFFEHLAYHLREAHRENEIERLLFDFGWLKAKLDATDVLRLAADYEDFGNDPQSRLVGEALQLSAHVLEDDPGQLAGHLIARLGTVESGPIQHLLAQARGVQVGHSWLEPILSGLPRGGDPLERTITAGERVKCVAITPDAGLVLGGGPNILTLWHLKTGQASKRVKIDSSWVCATAITPDGSRAAAANRSEFDTWDLVSGKRQTVKRPHLFAMLAITPDGKQVITCSRDAELLVWDFETSQELRAQRVSDHEIHALALSPDGSLIITAGADRKIGVWNTKTGDKLHTLIGHREEVNAASVSADGTRIVSGSLDGILNIWDLQTGQRLRSIDVRGGDVGYGVIAVALNPHDKRAISASFDGTGTIWDVESGKPIKTWRWHRITQEDEIPDAIALTPDGKHAVSVSNEGDLQLWNLGKEQYLESVQGHYDAVSAIIPTTDGRQFVSVANDNKTIIVWDMEAKRRVHSVNLPRNEDIFEDFDYLEQVAVTSDGRMVVAENYKPPEVWEIATERRARVLDVFAGRDIGTVAVTPGGVYLVCGEYNGPLEVWNLERQERIHTLYSRAGDHVVAVTPDVKYALTIASYAPGDNPRFDKNQFAEMRMWKLETGKLVRTFPCELSWLVNSLAVTADGTQAVAGSDNGPLQVWDLRTGQRVCLLKRRSKNVYGAVLTEDRQHTMSCSGYEVIVWNLKTGRELCHFCGDVEFSCCACTMDGSILLAGDCAGGVHAFRLHLAAPSKETDS